MAEYRYLFHDLRTNEPVGELPLVDVSYTPSPISEAGSFNAALPALDAGLARDLDVLSATAPGRRALFIEREGALVYSGIVWTRRYESASGRFVIGGSEPSSYLPKRRAIPAIGYPPEDDRVYVGVDEFTIWGDLVTAAMSGFASGIGITPIVDTAGGTGRDRTYISADLKPISQSMAELAEDDPGFEWANEATYVGDGVDRVPLKVLRAARLRGRTADASGLAFEYPGNVSRYEWPEDAATMANLLWGLGTAGGSNMDLIVQSWNIESSSVEGYPVLEDVLQASEVRDADQLQGMTDTERRRRDRPIELPVLHLDTGGIPEFGSYTTGDRARLFIDDPRRFPEPYDGIVRILALKVDVGRDGTERVTATAMLWPDGSAA